MIAELTKQHFDSLVGEIFHVERPEGAIGLRLVTAKALGAAMRDGGAFSLDFMGPAAPRLDQATYRMRHEGLGEIDIFIVPVGKGPEGIGYEAIFT